MATLQPTPQVPWRGTPFLLKILRGGKFVFLNLLVLVLPILLTIQGFNLAQNWIFSEKDAIYFNSYSDTAFSTVSLLLILALLFLCIRVLQNGWRDIQKSIRFFGLLAICALPLLFFAFDSYLMIGPERIVQSPMNSIGKEVTHTWKDVQWISVSHRLDAEGEILLGKYTLYFADDTQLEIWNSGGMNLTDLQRVNQLTSAHHIPTISSSPLSSNELKLLLQKGSSPSEINFLKKLFR
ncbi:hypothetical protein SAMN05444487_11620 [Marininema mesophilum]|uniref:PH domain-containing protein n=1 Tax=Marininema mesophilum TaxID=1048340 RepID=A0A1H3B9Y9_9BACL|nr:hypothetical protein [Marininema mesophilum]SDX38605.1 hypothetical protein SAMN05444487_11620 [Marininema mesophilum]